MLKGKKKKWGEGGDNLGDKGGIVMSEISIGKEKGNNIDLQ